MQVSTGIAEADTLNLARVFVGNDGWEKVKGSRRAQRTQKVKSVAEEFEAKSRELHRALTAPFPVRIYAVQTRQLDTEFYGVVDTDSTIFTSREWFGDWLAMNLQPTITGRQLLRCKLVFVVTGGVLKGEAITRPFVWSRSGEPHAVANENVLRAYQLASFSNALYFDTYEGFDKLAPSVLRGGPYGRLPRDLWRDRLASGAMMAKARAFNKTLPAIKRLSAKAVDGEAAHLESLASQVNSKTRPPVATYKADAARSTHKAFVCGLARETVEHENFFSLLNCIAESQPLHKADDTVRPGPAVQNRAKNRDSCLRRLKRKVKQASEPAIAYTLGIHGTKSVPRPVREALCTRFSPTRRPKSSILEEYRRHAFAPLSGSRYCALVHNDKDIPAVLLQRVNRRFCSYAEATAPPGARAEAQQPG